MQKISVVIPVYNEEENINELYLRLKKVFDNDLIFFNYEFIFVDDGSSDRSFELSSECRNKDPNVCIIKFTRNFGQHPAMIAGLKKSSGDYVVLMDADLQNPPEEIPRLVVKIEEGYDIVYGVRKKRKGSFIRRAGSKIYNKLLSFLLGISMSDISTTFRILSRRIVDEFLKIPEQPRYMVVLIAWMGYKSAFVETMQDLRKKGRSKYTYTKLFKMTVELLVGFSPKILRGITWFGFCVAGISFFIGGYFLFCKLIYHSMLPGFASLIVIITFFFGLLFIFLGVISEYIIKIFLGTLGRPYYIIDIIKG